METLLSCVAGMDLIINDTIFPHKDCHKATWWSPFVENKVENQIDHIWISKNWRFILDVCNKKGVDTGSDHHLLIGIIRFFIKMDKKNTHVEESIT
jgi:hypothetical protein